MTDRNASIQTLINSSNDAPARMTPEPRLSEENAFRSVDIEMPALSGEPLCEGAIVRGKYRLNKLLGKGGMGEVWLATHLELKTDVAIKFVHEVLASEATRGGTALERFRFEAQIAARLALGTRHVVAVHDTGEYGGCPFLVMEYVPGRTLEEEVERKGRLDPLRFASILDQVADAMDAAHAQEIVHRDLKPPNILLVDQRDGSWLVKVADFGVAKALGDNIPLDKPKETVAGHIVGSPAYMSPEQLGGNEIDARTDIWALGVVAFEVLAGRTCFDGATFRELMIAIMAGPTPSISAARPDIPVAVDRWLQKALAKKATDRFKSAGEMAKAFREALKSPGLPRGAQKAPVTPRDALTMVGMPGASQAPPAPKPAPAPRRRLVGFAILGALGAMALVLLIAILTSRDDHSSKPPETGPITPAALDNPAAIAPDSPVQQPPIVSPADTAAPKPGPSRAPTQIPSSVAQVPPAVTSAAPPPAPTPEPTVAPVSTAPVVATAPASVEPAPTRPRPTKRIDPSEIQ